MKSESETLPLCTENDNHSQWSEQAYPQIVSAVKGSEADRVSARRLAVALSPGCAQ